MQNLSGSLSARRAWIEITRPSITRYFLNVALRKESVDRNLTMIGGFGVGSWSLSARRAWIEMDVEAATGLFTSMSLSARRAWIEIHNGVTLSALVYVALRKESVDRNDTSSMDDLDPSKSLSARRERG